jgi:hypothetical protein
MRLSIVHMEEELFSSWYSHGRPKCFQDLGNNNITEIFAIE